MTSHGCMVDRGYSIAQKAMRKFGVSQRAVSDLSGVPLATVNRVLNKSRFQTVAYGDVLRVRTAIKESLKGVHFVDQIDFSDYDEAIS